MSADFIIGGALIATCFSLFMHGDITRSGWDSLQYLFGSPLEFYENCKRLHQERVFYTNYQPPVYVLYALWLYPLKLVGIINSPATFPLYLAYWLKVLTTGAFIASGFCFYRIALEYSPSKELAKYATAAWLTTPLALFSQFIFSQADIFYVLATLAAILMFLRRRIYAASLFISVAITFKYFPIFVFIPLLLLYEKRILQISLCCLIVIAPTAIFNMLYGDSLAYIEGVKNFSLLERIYVSSIEISDLGYWKIYLLLTSFAILCGITYFIDAAHEGAARLTAYVWLCASIFPFVFILWHPQWLVFAAPAIVLTSMLSLKREQFLLLDLAGMCLFVATASLTFPGVDASMFQGRWLGFDAENTYPMAKFFYWFGDHSRNVFLSGFLSYLILQPILKYKLLTNEHIALEVKSINYGSIRQRLYAGLLIFLLPAFFSIYKNSIREGSLVGNFYSFEIRHELLSTSNYEQTFVASGRSIDHISLFIASPDEASSDTLSVEIVDENGNSLAKSTKAVFASGEISWQDFFVEPIPVSHGNLYKIRIASATGRTGNAFTLFASDDDVFVKGEAIIEGVAQKSDFMFKVVFVKPPGRRMSAAR